MVIVSRYIRQAIALVNPVQLQVRHQTATVFFHVLPDLLIRDGPVVDPQVRHPSGIWADVSPADQGAERTGCRCRISGISGLDPDAIHVPMKLACRQVSDQGKMRPLLQGNGSIRVETLIRVVITPSGAVVIVEGTTHLLSHGALSRVCFGKGIAPGRKVVGEKPHLDRLVTGDATGFRIPQVDRVVTAVKFRAGTEGFIGQECRVTLGRAADATARCVLDPAVAQSIQFQVEYQSFIAHAVVL